MTANTALTRRQFLILLSLGAMSLAINPAMAKDGDSGDSDSGGDSDSDSDSDSDDDDGSSHSGKGSGRIDPDKIRDAIVSGKAIPLSKAMSVLREATDDRVIDVRLISNGSNFDYRFKVISDRGKVKTIKMDAKTGRIGRFLGM